MARDFTKYSLKDSQGVIAKELGKGRLVKTVISNFIDRFRNPSYDFLKDYWPDNLQGGKGVIRLISEIDSNNERNYYIDSPLTLNDGSKIAVCNQWGKHNLPNFILHAKSLDYDIVPENNNLFKSEAMPSKHDEAKTIIKEVSVGLELLKSQKEVDDLMEDLTKTGIPEDFNVGMIECYSLFAFVYLKEGLSQQVIDKCCDIIEKNFALTVGYLTMHSKKVVDQKFESAFNWFYTSYQNDKPGRSIGWLYWLIQDASIKKQEKWITNFIEILVVLEDAVSDSVEPQQKIIADLNSLTNNSVDTKKPININEKYDSYCKLHSQINEMIDKGHFTKTEDGKIHANLDNISEEEPISDTQAQMEQSLKISVFGRMSRIFQCKKDEGDNIEDIENHSNNILSWFYKIDADNLMIVELDGVNVFKGDVAELAINDDDLKQICDIDDITKKSVEPKLSAIVKHPHFADIDTGEISISSTNNLLVVNEGTMDYGLDLAFAPNFENRYTYENYGKYHLETTAVKVLDFKMSDLFFQKDSNIEDLIGAGGEPYVFSKIHHYELGELELKIVDDNVKSTDLYIGWTYDT